MRPCIFGLAIPVLMAAACAGRPDPSHPAPVKVGDYWTVRCRSGPATVKPLGFGLEIPAGFGVAAITVRDALRGLGYSLDEHIPAIWYTSARTAWPGDAALNSFKGYPYPGTGVTVVMGQRNGTPAVLGVVYALCADPGAPDSVTVAAQRYEADRITAELRQRGAR